MRLSFHRLFPITLPRLVFVAACLWWTGLSQAGEPRPPHLIPDYIGTVIPPNIAPLNFKVEEPGTRYQVKLHGSRGEPILLSSRNGSFTIPPRPWHALLRTNTGQSLYFEVSVADERSQWRQFQMVTNTVARDDIDGYLAYRLLHPVYSSFGNVGIYQRDLRNFEERPVLKNSAFGGYCLNCHTFLNHRTDTFALHIRTETSFRPMLLVRSNAVVRVDKTMGYLAWHPSGRLLVFSANKLSQFFHTVGENRDLFDGGSNLGVYWVDSNTLVSPPPIAQDDRNETWPAWAPDGRYLYFCGAPKQPIEQHRQVRYSLMRVRFDIDHNQWGEPETLLAAEDTGLSAAEPRVSPDGRWLLCCLSNYGNFPVWQPSSDLYVIDLTTLKSRRLDINSSQSESWHSWSSNSRWIVFTSKRLDGLFGRPFISYVSEAGRFHKAFVLPQENPSFYESCMNTFNLPELLEAPVQMSPEDLASAIRKPRQALVPQGDAVQEHRER